MSNLKLTDEIKDYEGNSIPDGKDLLTFRGAMVFALNQVLQDETVGAEEKAKRYSLSNKLFSTTDPTKFTSDEKALIEKQVGKIYNPLVYGRVLDLFGDNKSVE